MHFTISKFKIPNSPLQILPHQVYSRRQRGSRQAWEEDSRFLQFPDAVRGREVLARKIHELGQTHAQHHVRLLHLGGRYRLHDSIHLWFSGWYSRVSEYWRAKWLLQIYARQFRWRYHVSVVDSRSARVSLVRSLYPKGSVSLEIYRYVPILSDYAVSGDGNGVFLPDRPRWEERDDLRRQLWCRQRRKTRSNSRRKWHDFHVRSRRVRNNRGFRVIW